MTNASGGTSRETLRRLSQVAAVTSGHRVEDTIDWLLPMLAYFSPGPWRTSDDWFEEIKAAYGVEVPLHDIGESILRLGKQGILIRDSFNGEYRLADQAVADIVKRIESAGDLESKVATVWMDSLPIDLREDHGGRDGWQMLMSYCAAAFRLHGVDAVQVLSDDVLVGSKHSQTQVLDDLFDLHQITSEHRALLREAIALFFRSSDPAVTAYISQLADSTFNLLALCVDEATRQELREGLPELKIFVDTNILFSLMGTHDTPLAAASLDLFRVIKQAKLPFTLYYHAKTLAELTHTVEEAAHRLQRQTWTPNLSRALVRIPWNVSRVSGIEMRFHQLNAQGSIDPAAFCSRYQSPAGLLADFGLRIYRPPELPEGQDRLELRSTVIADYKEYLKRHPRRKNTNYAKLDHDASLWMLAKDQQAPTRKGPLFAGSFFLSSDYVLWKFDREVLRPIYGSRPVVVLPDALLQSLRPFVGGVEFDDRAFVQAFTASEFRAGTGAELAATVRRVASYLATFEDLHEETAARLLTDTILLEGLKRHEEGAPEFSEAIGKAIFAHNEVLVQERDELLIEREEQLGMAQRALEDVSAGKDPASAFEEMMKVLQEAVTKPRQVINNFGETVTNNLGGTYHNENTQVGAQGPAAFVENNAQTIHLAQVIADPSLIQELNDVKNRLLSVAADSDDFDAISGTQGAIDALEEKDEAKAKGFLRKAGQKAFDMAIEIGATVASTALRSQLGVGA